MDGGFYRSDLQASSVIFTSYMITKALSLQPCTHSRAHTALRCIFTVRTLQDVLVYRVFFRAPFWTNDASCRTKMSLYATRVERVCFC